jgi:hypothetical protein
MSSSSEDPAVAGAAKAQAGDNVSGEAAPRADDRRQDGDVAGQDKDGRRNRARSAMNHISFDLAAATTLKLTLYADKVYASLIPGLAKGR